MKTIATRDSLESRAMGPQRAKKNSAIPGTAQGPDHARQHKQIATIENSPYMAAQRQRLEQRFAPLQKQVNKTNMPDEVKTGMESSFNTDFSHVTVHPNSSKAPEVGALAFTQGSDIHFGPGQFKPGTSSGRELLGHELAHVVQQSQGRVQPTTEISGMPVNDNPRLEQEADILGKKAAG
nr:DUF4157 domain-containing protein [uncultured Desulfobacter sp.]